MWQWLILGMRNYHLISTHTSLVGCDNRFYVFFCLIRISTHTSLVGCDYKFLGYVEVSDISTHTSLVGCDVYAFALLSSLKLFLLTHPLWDVTWRIISSYITLINFYSHIPCGMWRNINVCNRNGSGFLLTHPLWDVTLPALSHWQSE